MVAPPPAWCCAAASTRRPAGSSSTPTARAPRGGHSRSTRAPRSSSTGTPSSGRAGSRAWGGWRPPATGTPAAPGARLDSSPKVFPEAPETLARAIRTLTVVTKPSGASRTIRICASQHLEESRVSESNVVAPSLRVVPDGTADNSSFWRRLYGYAHVVESPIQRPRHRHARAPGAGAADGGWRRRDARRCGDEARRNGDGRARRAPAAGSAAFQGRRPAPGPDHHRRELGGARPARRQGHDHG